MDKVEKEVARRTALKQIELSTGLIGKAQDNILSSTRLITEHRAHIAEQVGILMEVTKP